MGDNLRRKVLHVFKKLHRTRLKTFQGDEYALKVARDKINEEYKKYKDVKNVAAIEELNKFAEDVEHEIRTTVIQAVEKEPGTYELRITPDITLLDNAPYKEDIEQCKNKKSNSIDSRTSIPKDSQK